MPFYELEKYYVYIWERDFSKCLNWKESTIKCDTLEEAKEEMERELKEYSAPGWRINHMGNRIIEL